MDPKLKAITDSMTPAYSHVGWMLAGWVIFLALCVLGFKALQHKLSSR